MVLKIRATIHKGKLALNDPMPFPDGQQVDAIIQLVVSDEDAAIQAALGDLVRWPNPDDNRHLEVEAEAAEIDRAFSAGRPISEMIIAGRGEG